MQRHLFPILGIALLLGGCGESSYGTAPALSLKSRTHPNIVENTKSGGPDAFYVPSPTTVKVGQTITWTNKDQELHDVTSDTGLFASGSIPYSGAWRWKPTKPGRYPYFCTLHPSMHGVVIVKS